MDNNNKQKHHKKTFLKWRSRDYLVLGVIVLFVASWFYGKQHFKAHIDTFFEKAWPETESYKYITENHAEVLDKNGRLVGYIAKGMGDGYGGPLTLGVALDTLGNIQSLAVLEYRETPSFFQKVLKKGLLKKLAQRNVYDTVPYTQLVDGVTGATLTYRAISESVEEAVNTVAHQSFDIKLPDKKKDIIFGLPEIILIALFAVAVLRRKVLKGKIGKGLRWLTLIGGLVFIGFVYNRSFVMADINMVLLGYLPDWHVHLYWYILIIGLFLFKTKENWNTYCYDFCPFGACQEVLAQIGGAKNRPVQWPQVLLWLQRSLAIAAVSMALLFRNPGFSSFEIFGAIFDLNGSSYQFALLAIILLLSLFIYRPWCNYLCPLHKNTLEGLFDRIRKYAKLVLQLIPIGWKRN
ncbi:MAG: FMN-binding protein [Bacteroidetes bacterium]|nr:FMN-binding protein [Bacteroidota bacterium]